MSKPQPRFRPRNDPRSVSYTHLDSRGNAFADIRGRFGKEDYSDLMAFTDAVLAQYPQLDGERLGEMCIRDRLSCTVFSSCVPPQFIVNRIADKFD